MFQSHASICISISVPFLLVKQFCGLRGLCFDDQAESAIMALNCSGMVLGTQPIRCRQNKFFHLDLQQHNIVCI